MQDYEKRYKQELMAAKDALPDFRPGDIVVVYTCIPDEVKAGKGSEGRRIQKFEGLCISRVRRSLSSSFTVRKIHSAYGIEKTFKVCSPDFVKVELVRRGKVRQGKLYYIRNKKGAIRVKILDEHLKKAKGASNAHKVKVSGAVVGSL